MQPGVTPKEPQYHVLPRSIGRIASVTGSKAILLLDVTHENDPKSKADRPEKEKKDKKKDKEKKERREPRM